MSENVSGSCLCGDVGWEIDGPFEWMAHCHCSMCRKSHGTAFATFVTFPAQGFRWTRGSESVRRFESSPGSFRTFCGRCGSKLPSTEPFAYAPAGALVGELGIRPSAHMFVASKAPWHDITDDAAQFDAFPPSAGPAPTTLPTPRHTEPAADKIRGSCLCGAAAYELDGPLVSGGIVCCHCSRCRGARSAAHGTNLFVGKSNGANIRPIALGIAPSWSPDGRRIVYVARGLREITLVDVATGTISMLARYRGQIYHPDFSGDGDNLRAFIVEQNLLVGCGGDRLASATIRDGKAMKRSLINSGAIGFEFQIGGIFKAVSAIEMKVFAAPC